MVKGTRDAFERHVFAPELLCPQLLKCEQAYLKRHSRKKAVALALMLLSDWLLMTKGESSGRNQVKVSSSSDTENGS